MAQVPTTDDQLMRQGLVTLPPKPPDDATQAVKRAYSEDCSEVLAQAFAAILRSRGLDGTLPAPPGVLGATGAERRLGGGIGAKQVDVSWATEESGLLLGLSVKTINFRDRRSNNFQKNLTNRRGDLLFESVTLHRRFPFATLGGFLFLDHEAENDHTERRRSTLDNAHHRYQLFTGREDPQGRDEQFERLFIGLLNTSDPANPSWRLWEAGKPQVEVTLSEAFASLVRLVAKRNPDFYDHQDGRLIELP